MDDLPAAGGFVENDGSSIQKPWSVVQMKGGNRQVAEQLQAQILGLKIHVGWCGSSVAYLFKNLLEGLLEFRASGSACWIGARIKHGGVVVERQAKRFPVEIVESTNEFCERGLDFGFGSSGLVLGG